MRLAKQISIFVYQKQLQQNELFTYTDVIPKKKIKKKKKIKINLLISSQVNVII